MPPLTPLTPEDLAAVAARYGLGAPPRCVPLETGTINSNFRLETASGTLFLRVNEGKSLGEVAHEAELVDHLAARGVPTPRPRPTVEGRPFAEVRGKLLTLFPWVAGAHVDPPRPEHTRQVGAALARLHLAGRDVADRQESRYAPARILERARGLAARPDLPDEVAAALAEIVPALAELPPSPRGVIHGDLFPDNVLFGADGPILLDFEQASDGAFVYDLAVCVLAWCWDGDGHPRAPLASALRAGYEEVRPLEAADRQAAFAAFRFAALRFTVTRLSDVELRPGASAELKKLKNYREFLARWRRLEALGPGGLHGVLGLDP